MLGVGPIGAETTKRKRVMQDADTQEAKEKGTTAGGEAGCGMGGEGSGVYGKHNGGRQSCSSQHTEAQW